jgi:hypothetical protein
MSDLTSGCKRLSAFYIKYSVCSSQNNSVFHYENLSPIDVRELVGACCTNDTGTLLEEGSIVSVKLLVNVVTIKH